MALIYCFLTTLAQDTLWGILAYNKNIMKTRDRYQSTTYFYFSRDQVRVLYEYHETIKQLIPWPREFHIQFPYFEFLVKNTLSECHEADLFCFCHYRVWLFWLLNVTTTRRGVMVITSRTSFRHIHAALTSSITKLMLLGESMTTLSGKVQLFKSKCWRYCGL